MSLPNMFHNYEEFERECLRSQIRTGLSLEEQIDDWSAEEELDFETSFDDFEE